MTALDVAKAMLTAIVLMAVNIAASFGVVAVYAMAINPGHDEAYYSAKATSLLVPGSAVIVGAVLFFVATFLAARRRPERSAFAFALACTVFYVVIDILILYVYGVRTFDPIFAISYGTKIIAALAGAYAATTVLLRNAG